jgi:hypothetical protein
MQIFAIMLVGVSANAYADSWNCSHDDLVREVMIEYPQGGSLPCDVVYKKQTEGVEDQVLWSAASQEGYCEDKARELVAKLESWGWVCLETVSQETEAEPETEPETEPEAEPEPVPETETETETETEAAAETESE